MAIGRGEIPVSIVYRSVSPRWCCLRCSAQPAVATDDARAPDLRGEGVSVLRQLHVLLTAAMDSSVWWRLFFHRNLWNALMRGCSSASALPAMC